MRRFALSCLVACVACSNDKPASPKRSAPALAGGGQAAAEAEKAAEGAAEQPSEDPSFLAGTWEKIQDPDGAPKDWLLFNLPAQLTRLGGKPVRILERGGFLFTGKWVETSFDGPAGQKIQGSLEASADRKQLSIETSGGHRKVYQRGSPP